jgi:hypothetical protein
MIDMIKEIAINFAVAAFLGLLIGGSRHLSHNHCEDRHDRQTHADPRGGGTSRPPPATLAHP